MSLRLASVPVPGQNLDSTDDTLRSRNGGKRPEASFLLLDHDVLEPFDRCVQAIDNGQVAASAEVAARKPKGRDEVKVGIEDLIVRDLHAKLEEIERASRQPAFRSPASFGKIAVEVITANEGPEIDLPPDGNPDLGIGP